MKEMLKRFVREEDGQGMVEYVLIIAGVAVVIAAVIVLFGDKIKGFVNGITL